MIRIKSNIFRDLDSLAEAHFQKLKPAIVAALPGLKTRQRDFITLHLKEIITGKPKELFAINAAYNAYCTLAGSAHRMASGNLHYGLKAVFDYRRFTNTYATYYCGYDLAKALKVNTCPYCNRNYTVTVAQLKRITRPDFDHFFPKGAYPLLTLSFYNLIPSCLVCNRSVKNQKSIVYGKFLHPYEDGFDQAAKINYFPVDTNSAHGLANNFKVFLSLSDIEKEKSKRCKQNFELFELKAIYEESHGGEIADVIRKHFISSGKYLETIHNAFPQLGTIEELYRVAFGNYYQEDEFINRPLSKLTKDVVEQLVFLDPINKKWIR